MKIRLVGAELFHADLRTDRQTDRWTNRQRDMTKLIVAFRNFANAPKSETAKTISVPALNVVLSSGESQDIANQFNNTIQEIVRYALCLIASVTFNVININEFLRAE